MSDISTLSIANLALEISSRFDISSLEVEPYIRPGMGIAQNMSRIYVQRKMKNSNYEETYNVTSEKRPPFLYLAAGTHVNYPVFGWLYAVVSAGYSYGKFDIGIQEVKTDFLGKKAISEYQISQEVSAIQLEAGVQIRIGKSPKKHIETDGTKH